MEAGRFWTECGPQGLSCRAARPEQTKMLKEADERGTCLDLEVDGMRAMDRATGEADLAAKLLAPQAARTW